MVKLPLVLAVLILITLPAGNGRRDNRAERAGIRAVRIKAVSGGESRPKEAPGSDRHFRKWGERFFPRTVDWRWFKAQGAAESNLRPGAISPAGARGVMQLMPATSKEMAARLKIPDRPFDPEHSIMMGIAYDRLLWDKWRVPRPERERLRITFASYNAGLGNILKAQRLVGEECDPLWWDCVALGLGRILGAKARETVVYVSRIEAFYDIMVRETEPPGHESSGPDPQAGGGCPGCFAVAAEPPRFRDQAASPGFRARHFP